MENITVGTPLEGPFTNYYLGDGDHWLAYPSGMVEKIESFATSEEVGTHYYIIRTLDDIDVNLPNYPQIEEAINLTQEKAEEAMFLHQFGVTLYDFNLVEDRVTTNEANIATNTQEIANNRGLIDQNILEIGANRDDISALDSRVTTNENNIADNNLGINLNASNIQTNTNNIATLDTKVNTIVDDIEYVDVTSTSASLCYGAQTTGESVAIGHNTQAVDTSIAIGRLSTAGSVNSVAVGIENHSVNEGLTIGHFASADNSSIVLGGRLDGDNGAILISTVENESATNGEISLISLHHTLKVDNNGLVVDGQPIAHVKPDWDATPGDADEILNKPSVDTDEANNTVTIGQNTSATSQSVVIGVNGGTVGNDGILITTKDNDTVVDGGILVHSGSHVINITDDGINIGDNSTAVSGTVSIGNSDLPWGGNSVIIGTDAECDGDDSITIGHLAQTLSQGCIAIGKQASGDGDQSIAIGSYANAANGSVIVSSVEHDSVINGEVRVASDSHSIEVNDNGLEIDGTLATIVKPDWDASVGDADEIINRPALYTHPVAKFVGVGTSAIASPTSNSIAIGSEAVTVLDDSVGIGHKVKSSIHSVAIGNDAEAQSYGVAIGKNAKQIYNASILVAGVTIGNNASTTGQAIAIGNDTIVDSDGIGISNYGTDVASNSILVTTIGTDTITDNNVIRIATAESEIDVRESGVKIDNDGTVGDTKIHMNNHGSITLSTAESVDDAVNSDILVRTSTSKVCLQGARTCIGYSSSLAATADKGTAVGSYSYISGAYGSAYGYGASAGQDSIAIGYRSTASNDGIPSVAIGKRCIAGYGGIAIGNYAGYLSSSKWQNIAMGNYAGYNTQGRATVAIGNYAGYNTQADRSIAIGDNAGLTSQGTVSIAIGLNAGNDTQGDYAIAIGDSAGVKNQPTKSIHLVAENWFGVTNSYTNNSNVTGFYAQTNGHFLKADNNLVIGDNSDMDNPVDKINIDTKCLLNGSALSIGSDTNNTDEIRLVAGNTEFVVKSDGIYINGTKVVSA